LACYQTATFNTTTCIWDVTGTQAPAPTGLACYQTATFNTTTCVWDVTGTQAPAPTGLACYQTATFNTTTCVWDVTGTQAPAPTGLACYQTATFNTTTCIWDVTGTQALAPTGLACYETANFDTTSCAWVTSGTQPAESTTALACYETRSFNTESCTWVTSGTQPAEPTTALACYETRSFNTGSCTWDVTGSKPVMPNAGTNGTLTICAGITPTEAELFIKLIDADTGGSWTNTGLVYTYTVSATTTCAGVDATSTVTVTEEDGPDCGIVLGCGSILVNNAISPNGDALNDKFIIDNIDDVLCYPENTVEIYNRWGILVFETKNYNNTSNAFDGNSKGRTTLSQSTGLPSGTYFYILNYTSVDNFNQIQTNRKDGYLYLTH
jgi:gliding motility-associated-like protein